MSSRNAPRLPGDQWGLEHSGAAACGVRRHRRGAEAVRRYQVNPASLQYAVANKVGNGLPASYIVCTDPICEPLETNWVKAVRRKMIEIKAGHDAMVIAPDRLADLLDADAE